MPADRLFGGITLDAGSAGIPVGDEAIGIEHVKCIVADAVDKQLEFFLAEPQLRFRFLSLRQVTRHLGETQKVAITVPDRIDDGMSPETGAVLADAPAFAFVMTVGYRGFDGLLRQTVEAVLIGVEAGEMVAEDFGRLITLETLCAGIPAYDMAGWIEHVDGIVRDCIHQQPIALLVEQ
ncbi:hypothetical protein D3C87_1513500 [compost metagenome]